MRVPQRRASVVLHSGRADNGDVPPEVTNIPLAMLLVFGSAKLLAEIFEKLNQPAIVGEILAGVLIGPSVLGWIQPNPVISALADLGVLFLLFRVGLEVKTHELMRVGPVASLVALLGVIAPFFLGWGIMALFQAPHVESLFVGAAMVATSVGITAQVLAAKGLLQHRASQTILAAAVIDDILGLIVLAIVSSLARERLKLLDLVATALLAVGFTLLIAKWGNRTFGRLIPHVASRLKAGEVQFNLSIILLFGLSLLAMYAGVAAIVGAFLAGMALADSVDLRVRDLTHGVTELLVPFFLAGIGLQLDLAVFRNRSTLLLATVILIAAIVSKLVGCGLGALPFGWSDALRVGTGMIPRGEVGMVVAQLGLSMGVVQKPLYAVVVFMAVATTLIAPPLLSLTFRGVPRQAPVQDFQLG
jgi:Kef-type K+ transport system membrane component KefB